MNRLLIDIDSRNLLLERLQHAQGVEVCTDETFTYYRTVVGGFFLMFRKRTLRPDGRRSYYLTDEFARCIGFLSLKEMQFKLTRLQYWRRFVSIERLKAAFNRRFG